MSGEILFLAHRLPFPPDRGDRIRSWHMLRALARHAPVHVVAPVDAPADLVHVAAVERVAASVTTAVRGTGRGLAVVRALAARRPASVELFSVPSLHAAVRRRLATGTISTVFAFSGQMADYVPGDVDARFLMDFVDVDSAKFAQRGRTMKGLAGLAMRAEARRLQAFETMTARRADASIVISEAEAALFAATVGIDAVVIENGVDAGHFSPQSVAPVAVAGPLIVFTGQMDYAPNVTAVTDFSRNVMPLIDSARFAIVGRAPTASVRALASERVIVTGEVADTRPWLAAADVVVAPLTLARGVQNKVLEAMAMARPVVLSAAAAQGIDADDGAAFLVAKTATEQAAAIMALLAGPERAAAMGAAARARVLDRYSWDARLAPLAGLVA